MSDTPKSIAGLSPEEKRAYLAQLLRKKAAEGPPAHVEPGNVGAGLAPIQPGDNLQQSDWLPLSHGQRALWFLHRLAPESVAYNLIYAAGVHSTIDLPALQRAAQALISRHPILSATYTMRNGEPMQRFHREQQVHIEVIDASNWSWEQMQKQLQAEGDRPFDLERGPVWRVTLFARGEQDNVLCLVLQHIVVDFFSLDMLADELSRLYAAERVGAQAQLLPHPPQYTDFMRWQNERLAGPEGERLWSYWQEQLSGELPLLNLPIDRPRPPVQSYRGAFHSFELGKALSQKLKTLAAAEKVTPYMLQLAAFQVLLYRYTDQEDILVATPMAGRSRAELERIVGYLAGPVVLRANMSGNPTFKEFLGQVRRVVIDAIEHQDYPFPLLVERLQPKRDASHSPIFQAVFVWDKQRERNTVPPPERGQAQPVHVGAGGEVEWSGGLAPALHDETAARMAQEALRMEPVMIGQRGAAFDLTLRMSELDGSLSADVSYNADLFEADTITRMEQHLRTLLEGIVANPGQHIADLPLLTEAELHQLLLEWNDTQGEYPEHIHVHQLFEEQVRRQPDAVAVVFEGEQLTYAELNRRANIVAHALQAMGVGPEVLVGVCMERSLEMVIALLAILKSGGAYVPLDPTYPRERLDYMLQDAGMSIVLTQQRLRALLPGEGTKLICLDTNEIWQGSDPGVLISRTGTASSLCRSATELALLACGSADLEGSPLSPSAPAPVPTDTMARSTSAQLYEENPLSNVSPDNLVYMIYTSGSTGKPKGVMNIHRGLSNRLHWMQQEYQLTPEDRIMQKTPFSFDVSVWEFFWPLITGASLVVAKPGGHQDPTYLISLIDEQQITTMHFVPSMLQAFLAEQGLERCKSLKRVICSGEALPFELQERFFAQFDANTTGLHNLYGPTEASIDVTYWQCRPGSRDWVVPIGRPIANTQIYILDRSRHPVPIGVPAELYIGGVGVARGYFNRPELTAEKFVPDPFSREPGAKLFKTGDLARYRADGAIEFLGRVDHQVKIRGFRIELGEIEAVLAEHPAIKEVVVVAREDVPGNKRLVAYLVCRTGADELSVDELRSFLKEKLPHYMIPATFMFLDALPLMPNGKVNRKTLPVPDALRPQLETAFVAPRTPAEEMLARIWTAVLNLDKVGVNDNFFDLGGASIQGLQIITKANEVGLQLTPEMLFEHQTIAELAAVAGTLPTVSLSLQEGNGNGGVGATLMHSVDASQALQSDPTARANTIIESIGIYLPPKAVSTRDILQNCYKPVNFPLEQLTGINTRRMAGETEFSIDLAEQAVASCLANSKYQPQDIDLLICANISRCDGPDFRVSFEPSTAVKLKRCFGFSNAIVFDISNACTGMFTAISIVDAFLKAGLVRRGMVVSGEYITHLTQTAQKEIESYLDSRLACLTVGDAGAAIILEQAANNRVGFHELELYTLGRYYDLCIAKASDREHGGAIMYTDSVKVSAVNIQQAVSHAAYMIERSGWPPESFQHIVMHQTSQMTLNDAAREINSYFKKEVCSSSNVINNITHRGNTATTTHIVALMDAILADRIKSGDNVIFGVTGSGATIGTALYTFDDLPDRLRRSARSSQAAQTAANGHKANGATGPGFVERSAGSVQAGSGTVVSAVASVPQACRVRFESVGTVPKEAQVRKEALELAVAASRDCLARSSYSRSDIDLLIYTGIYRDDFLCEPAVASMVAGELRMNDVIESQQEKKTFAFDLLNGALGFLNACHVAAGMISAQKMKRVMVVAAEIENNLAPARDAARVARQPDGLSSVGAGQMPAPTPLGIEETGSAVILDESPDGKTGFGDFVFKYFTDYIEAFAAYSGRHGGKTVMRFEQDPALKSYYVQCIRNAVDELLRIEQLDLSQLKIILPPQMSPKFLAGLRDTLNISKDRFVEVPRFIEGVAHDSHDLFTSSLPYTLQYVQEHKLAQPGDIGLIIALGSGIQVGCATYYF